MKRILTLSVIITLFIVVSSIFAGPRQTCRRRCQFEFQTCKRRLIASGKKKTLAIAICFEKAQKCLNKCNRLPR